jgi:excisionase family DNA binding protein
VGGAMTASKVRTVAAQRDQVAHIERRITEDGSAIVPPRIAAWLERRAGVTADLRIRLRGVDREAYAALAALHLSAMYDSSSDCGTKVGAAQETTAQSETWLTTSEAAQQADVTDRCVRKWIAEGRLPATRRGGRWLIHRKALHAKKFA